MVFASAVSLVMGSLAAGGWLELPEVGQSPHAPVVRIEGIGAAKLSGELA